MTRRTSTRQIDIPMFPYLRATVDRLPQVRSSSPLPEGRFRRIWFAKVTISELPDLLMNEEVRRHRIVQKLPRFSRGKRNPVLLQGGCSRQQILHLLVISLNGSPGALSSTSTGTFLAYNLGSITTHLPQLASPHRCRIRMRGM